MIAQLAFRAAVVGEHGVLGKSPFVKIKGLIIDMLAKSRTEAGADATEKVYCDEAMAKTKRRMSEEHAVERVAIRIGIFLF